MENEEQISKGLPRNTIMFCDKPWKFPTIGLTFLVLLTFAWGFYILDTYTADDFFDGLDDLSITEFLFRDVAGSNAQSISEAVAPGVVGIGATGVNMSITASGVIVSPGGHVLTTLHSVNGLPGIDVHVRTASGIRQYPAEIVKSNPAHDLVLLKILTTDRFLFFPLADTSVLRGGERVFALGQGAAGNLILKEGRILAINRTSTIGDVQLTTLLGSDAVYSWEQNGGPLVNQRGELVGVNLTLVGPSGMVEGHAVPSHVILAHFQDVIDFKIAPPFLAPPANVGAVSVPAAGTAPAPRTAPAVGGGGSAAWWTMARARMAQGAQENPSLGMNVAAQTVPAAPARLDTEHLGGVRIGGYTVGHMLGLALLGLAAGIASGMMTMGGGVIHVAGMMIFFGYGMYLIRPVVYLTNLFVFGAAARRNHRSGLIMWDTVRALTPWAVVGVVVGYFIGNAIGDEAISVFLGIFALLMTAKGLHEIFAEDPEEILVKAGQNGEEGSLLTDDFLDEAIIGGPRAEPPPPTVSRQTRNAGLGMPVGLVSGILGISGGVVAVPLQRFFGDTSLRNAIANSSVIVFWSSLSGALVSFSHGISTGLIEWQAPLSLSAIMVPGAVVGGIVGAKLMKVLPTTILKWTYSGIMAVIAVKMLLLS